MSLHLLYVSYTTHNMYPELYTFSFGDSTIPVMTYGVGLTLSFALFYWMLAASKDQSMLRPTVNLLSFFIVTFLVSRISHVLLYLGLPTKSAFSPDFPVLSFFLMSDFYFSIGGAVIGFV